MRLTIVSGGQTGADRGAMDAAIRLGLDYGGWAPAGFRAEDGRIPEIYSTHMRESSSSDYGMRTRLNVQDSDATLVVSYEPELTGGSAGTAKAARSMRRNCKHLVLPQGNGKVPDKVRAALLEWMRVSRVEVLNVAGPRESKEPGIQAAVRDVLVWLLEDVATEQLREVIDTVSMLESVVDSDAPREMTSSSPAASGATVAGVPSTPPVGCPPDAAAVASRADQVALAREFSGCDCPSHKDQDGNITYRPKELRQ